MKYSQPYKKAYVGFFGGQLLMPPPYVWLCMLVTQLEGNLDVPTFSWSSSILKYFYY